MQNQTVNIADLIQPKFKAGQTVFQINRDFNGRISNIRPVYIVKVCALVQITAEKGVEKRSLSMHYVNGSGNEFTEAELIASLDDLAELDRAPRVG